jgi:outer membrane protein
VLAAGYDVDMATATIGVAQSSLLPQVSVQGSASRSVDTDMTLTVKRTEQASIVGRANMPIYDGGMAAAQTRQPRKLSCAT